MRQYAYNLGSDYRGGSSKISLQGSPFVRPESFLNVVVQHGEIKVYGLSDDEKESVTHDFLVVGTGVKIDSGYLDHLICIGTVLIADSKYGYTVYYVQPKEEFVDEGVSKSSNLLRNFFKVNK